MLTAWIDFEVLATGTRIIDLYPQPSSGAVSVVMQVGSPAFLNAAVYDLLGRRPAVVEEGWFGEGIHRLELGRQGLPAGVYALVIESETSREVRPLVFVH